MCEASGVCISSSPCRCGTVVPGVLACVHAYIHMRVCVDVYAYICAGVHVCVYMHMRVRPCTRTCARVCMRIHVHAYACMEGPGGGASACLTVSWARVRTYVHVHVCTRVYAWVRMCTVTVFGKHCECIAQKCTHLERLPPLASHLLLPSHCVLTRHGGKKI